MAASEPQWVRSWEAAPAPLADVDSGGTIVAANESFRRICGISSSEIAAGVRWPDLLTAGSRLLYETQIAAMLHLQGSVDEVMVDLRARDGRVRPALMTAVALREADRTYGVRVSLTSALDRRAFENDLIAARSAAEHAHEESSRAQLRLTVQANATAALASSTDPTVAVHRLAGVFVPALADSCIIFTADPDAAWATPHGVALHADPTRQDVVERVAQLLPTHATAETLFARTRAGGPATLISRVDSAYLDGATTNPELRGLLDTIGTASAIVAPSYARGRQLAVLILTRGAERPAFTDEDRTDVGEVAARAGIVIDNTRRYAREHADSMTLQQSLLTSPPRIDGLEIEVRYLPAHDEVQVGGDWYDVYVQPDGLPVVAIGDVVGHDIKAAAAMGQLRATIRTIGHTVAGTPGDTLSRADRAAQGLGSSVMASAVLARVEAMRSTSDEVRAILRWTNAGHPPPALVRQDGTVTILERPADLLLGVLPTCTRRDHTVELQPGDTVLLYTDGLIERAEENLEVGLRRLSDLLSHSPSAGLAQLCDRLVDELGTAGHDDVALLAVRLLDESGKEGQSQASRQLQASRSAGR